MTCKTSLICWLIAALMFVEVPVFSQETGLSKDDLAIAEFLIENHDGTLAFQIFTELAKSGDAEAMAGLGRCYFEGIGVPVDRNKAFKLFSRAAELGEPEAIYGIGVCYSHGWGTTKNMRLAMENFIRAAKFDHPSAIMNLACIYGNAEEAFYNPELAEITFKRAIELKAPAAEVLYGDFLFRQKRYGEAMAILQGVGDDILAWKLQAQCYYNGWGTSIDIRKAVQYATEYASANPSDAIFGAEVILDAAWEELFFNGKSELYVNYLKQAADYGHPEAQFIYAVILKGQNDYVGALKYAIQAADGNVRGANLEAGVLAKGLEYYDIALKYLELAVLEANTEREAVENLVIVYAYHLGQKTKSHHWAQRGTELGSAYCRNELAEDALKKGTPEGLARAYALIYASVIDGDTNATDWIDKHIGRDYETLRELADNGNADALIALGILGLQNENGHPSIPIGLELLEKAVELKSGVACRYLGNIFYNGIAVDKDLRKAFDLFKRGAELGDNESAFSVVYLLYNENEFADVPFEECKKWCDISMQFDDTCAFMYGQLAEIRGKDVELAKKMYKIAAMNDDSRALLALHGMYIDDDFDLSSSYLLRAVDGGDDLALFYFGQFQTALGQPRKAFISYIRSLYAGNNTLAPYEIASCLLEETGCSVNVNMALKMAEYAFQNGDAQSCSLLGGLYRDGIVVPRNESKAKQYFEEGVRRGDNESKRALGLSVKE